jgi:hypothetical protein
MLQTEKKQKLMPANISANITNKVQNDFVTHGFNITPLKISLFSMCYIIVVKI